MTQSCTLINYKYYIIIVSVWPDTGVGQNNGNTADTVHISLLICCWTTFWLQYSRSPSWNGLVQVWRPSSRILYYSSPRTCSACFRDVGGGNLFLTLVSKTDQSASLMFKSGDCAGQGRCWCSPSCCSEITSGSWDAPDYPTCSRTLLQLFGYEG
jgi:hypothetical protein